MRSILSAYLFLSFVSMQVALAEEVQLDFGSTSTDLNLGSRIITIIIFLLVMTLLGYVIVHFAKTGKLKIPGFLINKKGLIKDLNINKNINPYTIDLIHKQVFDDGSEMWVLEINDKHILVSKTPSAGFSYITELKSGQLPQEIETLN